MYAIAPFSPLGNQSALLIPTGTTPVHFFGDYRETNWNNELGYFFVDGPDGRITKREGGELDGSPVLSSNGLPQYLRPGDADYAFTALGAGNSEVVFSSGEIPNLGKADKISDVLGDRYIAFYLIRGTTTQAWRDATTSNKPSVWFSIGDANQDGHEHFQRTQRKDIGFRSNILQFKVEDSNIADAKRKIPGHDRDFNDLVFSVNIVPYAYWDSYSVFNSVSDFSGAPRGFETEREGLVWNDYSPSNPVRKPTVTHISVDDGDTWLSVTDPSTRRDRIVRSDAHLHGTLTVRPNGAVAFQPNANDPWWRTTANSQDTDPEPIVFLYRISDGIDTAEAGVEITHGYYQKGTKIDNLQQGKKMYFLAGGGSSSPFDDGRKRFFQEGSNGKDIVLIAQGTEQLEFVNEVFDFYAYGKSGSVTSLNITTRDQANDARLAQIIQGADLIWFGGGAQSFYQSIWVGTALFRALARAAANNVAIGGTSAGMAILGEAAYVELPWDSVKSRFATLDPRDQRINIQTQGSQLPFNALSAGRDAPLNSFITDTHFSWRDRMGRLATFAAKSGKRGLGIDESTALLIERVGSNWNWSVFGEGYAYVVAPSSPSVRPRYTDGGRLTYGPLNIYRIAPGASASLQSWLQTPSYRIWVNHGTIYTTDNGGSLY